MTAVMPGRAVRQNVNERFPAMDGMRALACYSVIATHVGFESGRAFGVGPVAPWLSRLDTAVPIFLMLSGFLLYRPFVVQAFTGGDRPRTGRFYWRRAVRVLPAYWLTVVVTLGLLGSAPRTAADWWSYLSMTQIYDGHDHNSSLSHLWTLAAEVSLYLVVPLFGMTLRRTKLRRTNRNQERIVVEQFLLVMCIVVASVAWQVVTFSVPALGFEATKWLPGIIDWFATGMLLAVLSVVPASCRALPRLRSTLGQWAGAAGQCWLTALVLFWLLSLPLAGPLDLTEPSAWQHVTKNLLQGLVVLFLMLPLVLGGANPIAAILGSGPARFLGRISYGVYLWHLPVLIFFQRESKIPVFQGHFAIFFLVTAASATVLGTASWFLVERPLLRRLSNSSWRGRPSPTTDAQIPITHSA
jgi:peptidoglycan/LPS O-acetylase OafA/YrhL